MSIPPPKIASTRPLYLKAGAKKCSLSPPAIMGILNVTPDSFSDGGRFTSVESVLEQACKLQADGATILDVGGESSRPGAQPVSANEEIDRIAPIVTAINKENLPVLISIDTYKSKVAEVALDCGASIVNDISALMDPCMADIVAKKQAALVLMHMRDTPQTMQEGLLKYDNLIEEISIYLSLRIAKALKAGVDHKQILIDPGIGFGKTCKHNLTLTRDLGQFLTLGCPILYGPSRKRFLGEITRQDILNRDPSTAAACVAAVLFGASVLRVHNVEAVKDAVTVAHEIRSVSQSPA